MCLHGTIIFSTLKPEVRAPTPFWIWWQKFSSILKCGTSSFPSYNSFLCNLAFSVFISFHFGLLGLHFLSFWPFGPSFPFILAFWASFPFILNFWTFIFYDFSRNSFPVGGRNFEIFLFLLHVDPPMAQTRPWASIRVCNGTRPCNFLYFGLVGNHFLSFWSFGPSFPFTLAFWAFISFHFGLLGLDFLSCWLFGLSFPFLLAFWAPFLALPVANFGKGKIAKFKRKIAIWGQILAGWPLGLHFLSFSPFGPSFPFIFAFWAFISFHFSLLGFHFLSFWPFGPSFPFILVFWAFISFHFGFFWRHFWLCRWQILEKKKKQNLEGKLPLGTRSWLGGFWAFISFHFGLLGFISFHFGFWGFHFLSFWPFGLSFAFILAFLAPFLALQVANFGKGKIVKFKGKIAIWCQILAGWLLGIHFLSFWLFGFSFPCI